MSKPTKDQLAARNKEIYDKRSAGATERHLQVEYGLSARTIGRIIADEYVNRRLRLVQA